jgi:hypothetical protein
VDLGTLHKRVEGHLAEHRQLMLKLQARQQQMTMLAVHKVVRQATQQL